MNPLKQIVRNNLLTFSFLLIILLFITFGFLNIQGLITQHSLTQNIYKHPLVVSNASLKSALNITKMHRSMKDVVLSGNIEERTEALTLVNEYEKIVYTQLDIIRENILGDEGKLFEVQTRNLFVEWKSIRTEVVHLMRIGKQNKAIDITKGRGADHVEKLEVKMLALTSYARRKANYFIAESDKNSSRLEILTILLTTLGIIFSGIIAVLAIRKTNNTEAKLIAEKEKLLKALEEIEVLRGIIPICSYCKQIRDDQGSWNKLEEYIQNHSGAEFSHGICPECLKKHHPEFYED